MIDWVNVALNALWIFGVAVLLAAVSYHRWLAAETSRRLRDVLSRSSWKISFSAGMSLICAGVGYGLADRWWEHLVWTGLLIVFLYQLATDVREGRKAAVRAKRSS
jgi:hypothetical protein